jgi:hypothetical protein
MNCWQVTIAFCCNTAKDIVSYYLRFLNLSEKVGEYVDKKKKCSSVVRVLCCCCLCCRKRDSSAEDPAQAKRGAQWMPLQTQEEIRGSDADNSPKPLSSSLLMLRPLDKQTAFHRIAHDESIEVQASEETQSEVQQGDTVSLGSLRKQYPRGSMDESFEVESSTQ